MSDQKTITIKEMKKAAEYILTHAKKATPNEVALSRYLLAVIHFYEETKRELKAVGITLDESILGESEDDEEDDTPSLG
ncbi:MAG: hypothetical protein ACRENF_08170 [Thermodesulfobacteriota bacterium]